MRFLNCVVLALLAAGVCGCTMFESRETRLLRQSPDYKAGYSDGCATASAAGTAGATSRAPIRDDTAFRTNRAYNMGWSAGRGMCRTTVAAPPGGGPLPSITR
jgi:hypothetical protein